MINSIYVITLFLGVTLKMEIENNVDLEFQIFGVALSWKDIFYYWNAMSSNAANSILSKGVFKTIYLTLPPNACINEDVAEWWDNENVDRNMDQIIHPRLVFQSWGDDKPGYRNSAEMLLKFKDNHENLCLILISAAVLEIDKHFPHEWRGSIHSDVDNLRYLLRKEMEKRNIYFWHSNTKNALPVTVPKRLYQKPDGIYDLMHIIMVDISLTLSTWTLVHFAEQEDTPAEKEVAVLT
jgi:hypothetical protein